MEIERTNYEIWFTDWLDGNLSSSDVEKLKLFLDRNPDLKEEFEELSTVTLKPSLKTFSHKNLLKKIPSEISGSQFESLCIAYLENDLSSDQASEFMEIIEQDQEKNKTFELFRKTKLVPVQISFKNKNLLFRRTIGQRVLRLSVIGLSSAAAVALLIMTFSIIPHSLPGNRNSTAQITVANINKQEIPIEIPAGRKTTVIRPVSEKRSDEQRGTGIQNNISVISKPDIVAEIYHDSIAGRSGNPELLLQKLPVDFQITLEKETGNKTLIASNVRLNLPDINDNRSNIGRFLARTFREKILREKTVQDSPLKGYEIAEAGIAGLNKLLGWQMALDKTNDENGELKSVYFSSKILKFNAPVKKSNPLP
jgi:hypothetical protein